jgi:ketosteroid isomerase-like protein
MKILLTLLLSTFVSLPLPPPTPTQSGKDDVDAVKKVLSEFTKAELAYDVKAVDQLLDEHFIYVGNDGSLTSRVDLIKLTDRERNPLDLLEITEVDVRTSGDTAIATGLIHEKGLIDGRSYEFRGRTLTALVRKGGYWYCLAIHD